MSLVADLAALTFDHCPYVRNTALAAVPTRADIIAHHPP